MLERVIYWSITSTFLCGLNSLFSPFNSCDGASSMVQLATAPLSPVLWQTEENKSCLDGGLAKILNTYIKIQNIASFHRSCTGD